MSATTMPVASAGQPIMSRETFASLLEANLHAVRTFVRRHLRNADYTDDIIQRTLLLAFLNRHQLRAASKFRSWLFSIAINETRMFLRRLRPVVPITDFTDYAFADRTSSPLASYEQTERVERLQAALARLPERDQTAIRLLDLAEYSLEEAADQMSVSKAALKSILFRARRRLARTITFQQLR
jgi:RNA polymerase sigma factor (sigma-70 family)